MEEPEKKKKDPIWKHAKIGTPDYKRANQLWQDALLYFEWCDENPVDAAMNVVRYKKEKHGGSKEMKKQDQKENITRPYTLFGFCAFTGIRKWSEFKSKHSEDEDFSDVISTIENIIASQQIDGALTGVFKENLTARLNGLADKQVAEMNGEIDVKNEHKFTGFYFIPHTDGLENSEQTKVLPPEPEPQYAEIVDVEPTEPEKEIIFQEV